MFPEPPLLVGALGLAVLAHRGRASSGLGSRAWWRLVAGLVVALAALTPAVERAAESSFAVHMLQHQAFLLVAAPLLASAAPVRLLAGLRRRPVSWSLPGGPAARALIAAAVYLAVVLLWHVPAAYDAALADLHLHLVEHATMLGAGTALWAGVFGAARDERALGAAVVALAGTAIVGAGLGVVLLTSSTPLYAGYSGEVALQSQRIGGASMKVGTLLVHAGAAVWLTVRWLHRLDEVDDRQRRERSAASARSETSTVSASGSVKGA